MILITQYNGLLDVALYRNVDTSLTSNRNAADTIGDTIFQGSNLGSAIWTASMTSTYRFLFSIPSSSIRQNGLLQVTWSLKRMPSILSLWVLMVGALVADAVTYDVLVTTSAVPVPGAVWLFGSALTGFMGFGRRKQQFWLEIVDGIAC